MRSCMQHLVRVKSGAHLARCVLQLPLTARRSRHREQELLWPGKPSVQHGLRHAAAAVAAPQQPGQRTNAITIVQDRLCTCKDRNRGRHPGWGGGGRTRPANGAGAATEAAVAAAAAGAAGGAQQGQQQAQVRVHVQQTCCWAPNAAQGGRPAAGAGASATIVLLGALTAKGGPSNCGSDRATDGKLCFASTIHQKPFALLSAFSIFLAFLPAIHHTMGLWGAATARVSIRKPVPHLVAD
jgi:hypothetical protein